MGWWGVRVWSLFPMDSRLVGEEGRMGSYDLGEWGFLSDFLVLLLCADADVLALTL